MTQNLPDTDNGAAFWWGRYGRTEGEVEADMAALQTHTAVLKRPGEYAALQRKGPASKQRQRTASRSQSCVRFRIEADCGAYMTDQADLCKLSLWSTLAFPVRINFNISLSFLLHFLLLHLLKEHRPQRTTSSTKNVL